MLICSACGLQVPEGPACPVCGSSLANAALVAEPEEPDWVPEPAPPRPKPRPRPLVQRPGWVYLVFGAYVLLAGTVTFGPILATIASGSLGGLGAAFVFALVVVVCGGSLVVIPIRAAHDLPVTQRSIWLPLFGSAMLAAFLFCGLSVASHEFAFGGKSKDGEDVAIAAFWIGLPVVWLGWSVLFGLMAFRTDPERFAGRLYKTLLAGSVLELLIAIPMHMVVRQRGYCCAGFGTGLGIGIGLLVMMVALGPAVVFLFYRRYQQVYARHR